MTFFLFRLSENLLVHQVAASVKKPSAPVQQKKPASSDSSEDSSDDDEVLDQKILRLTWSCFVFFLIFFLISASVCIFSGNYLMLVQQNIIDSLFVWVIVVWVIIGFFLF